MHRTASEFFGTFKLNWKSALTVALVSIPLSISIAIASGASPVTGIITAVWAGLIASIFSSSRYNIVGPAGALTAILAAAALQFGPGALATIAVIAGVFILCAWALNLDKYISYIPSSVIHGFTLSVAITIALSQLNFAFGLQGLAKHSHFVQNVFETLTNLHRADPAIVGFFICSLAFMFMALKLLPKIPGAVLLAPIAIAFGYLSQHGALPFNLILLRDVYPNLSLSIFSIPEFAFSNTLIIPALTVALVAILETVLSAKIADNMTKTKHDQRKEILGLGLANIGSGFFGGLPASGVFVRTSLNVRSHATSKMSQGINGIIVALISVLVLSLFSYIPMAGVAAILIFAAIRMVEVSHFKRLFALDKTAFLTAVVVTAISVYQDAMVGILVGTVMSLIVLIERMSKGQFELVVNKDQKIISRIIGEDTSKHVEVPKDSNVCVYSIKGHLTYTNAFRHLSRMKNTLTLTETAVIRLRELAYIDVDGIEALDEIMNELSKKGVRVIVTGVSHLIAKQLKYSKAFEAIVERGDVFDRAHQALNALGYSLSPLDDLVIA
jgi:SulP family sulfate permease